MFAHPIGEQIGGEAGIRTLGRALRPYNGLANHRLQPLGHLTAARNLSIRQPLSYGGTAVPRIVPEIVPASLSEAARVAQARPRSADPKAGGSFRQQPFRQLLGARRFTRMSRRPNFLVSRRFEDAERSDLACETGRA